MQERVISERESLDLITEMIQKAKGNFNESGTGVILWGIIICICGITSFAEQQWNFRLPIDIWWLTIIAIIPHIWLSIRNGRRKVVKTYQQAATDATWLVYAISIYALVLYVNLVPDISDKMMLHQENLELFSRNIQTGEQKPFHLFTPSASSVFLILYAFPTLITGLINRFKPMIYGAIVCYLFFVISLYTPFKYDMILSGLSGICNWLIPGLILRKQYLNGRGPNV